MTLLRLILEELKAIVADKAIAVTLFGGVLFYALLYPLPYLNQVPTEQALVVVDLDNTSLSRELIRHADASPKIRVARGAGSVTEAQHYIASGDFHGLLVIPAGFKRDLLLGKGATLSYGGDASYFLVYSALVEGLVTAGMDAAKSVQLLGMLSRGESFAGASLSLAPMHLNAVPAYNPGLGYTPYVVPGLFLLILHQTLLIGTGILGAGQWRKSGYWQQVSALELLMGRIAAFGLIYAALGAFYLGWCYHWYGVSVQAGLGDIAAFIVPFYVATAAAGVATSCLFIRRDMPTQVMLLASMPILFVSGFVWPLSLIPEPLVMAAQAIPAVPAIFGMLKLNQLGAGFDAVFSEWLMLWVLALVYLALAWWGLVVRRREVNSPITPKQA
ncbi:ABC transporter permease [Shewanella litorisediminis]|uniref:ABC transporter permease n=1 Tax=Shewanella litorisediminis TaxID=1173586 RepID=A0ABX7G4T2_9GAMM|nr:ABC transporter permease [Shewanella litorisediminis]MCL2917839.1 ABC transporter permease [Shewanella litorisediminis]QRH02278.1 ABC transporter permease [Shewanella litorisediminis]